MIDGVEIKLGGTTYIVPPLNFKAIRNLEPELAELSGVEKGQAPSASQLGTVIKVIHAAMKRNYPEISMEMLEELIDLGNCFTVMNAILGSSGLEQGKN